MSSGHGDASAFKTCGGNHTFFRMFFEHPRLTATDAASIRVFLQSYDQYVNGVTERAKQLVSEGNVSGDIVSPVSLPFCVDPEWLESLIALGFIPGVTTAKDLTDFALRSYLNGKCEEPNGVDTLESLDEVVSREVQTNMVDNNTKSRIEILFVSYHSLLRRHGLSWILLDDQNCRLSCIICSSPRIVT